MTDWVFMHEISKVIFDTDLKTVCAITAENPPEGDLCFARGLWFYSLWVVFLIHLPLLFFEASKLQELHFFVSPFCRISRSSGIVRFL